MRLGQSHNYKLFDIEHSKYSAKDEHSFKYVASHKS